MYRNALSALSFTGLLQLAVLDTSRAVEVTWISPSAGDTFVPGDTIVGQWSAKKPVVSPSFRLCTAIDPDGATGDDERDARRSEDGGEDGGESSCGQAVWPTVQTAEDGSYLIHM